jgi:hypothetical protein
METELGGEAAGGSDSRHAADQADKSGGDGAPLAGGGVGLKPGDPSAGSVSAPVLLIQHAPLILAGMYSVLTAMLLIRVGEWYPPTALAVLAQGGTANVLLGSALTMVPLVAAGVVGGVLGHLWRPSWRDAEWNDRWVRLGWSIAIVIGVGVLFAPPALVLLSLLMAPFLRGQSDELPDRKGAFALGFIVIAWLLLVAKPWWPLERVETRSGDPAVGYVLSTMGRDYSLLVADPRRVMFLPSSSVTSRELCVESHSTFERWFDQPVWSMINDPAGYPECTP